MIRYSLFSCLILFVSMPCLYAQDTAVSVNSAVSDSSETFELTTEQKNEIFTARQYKVLKVHKKLAFTTGGLLLASGAMGTYHFFSMQKQGHDYRDSIGFEEDDSDQAIQTKKIKSIWRSDISQLERIIHGTLIASSVISYTATATIELTMPRMSRSTSWFSNSRLHKYLFFLHVTLMAANVGLGFAESYALSQGYHDAVIGLGITHMVVGFSAPVIMMSSGLVYKIPNEY